jgi:multidrug efflux system membrane fusion protein
MPLNRLALGLLSALIAASAFAPAFAQPSSPATAPENSGVPVTVTKPLRQDMPVLLSGLGLVAAGNTVVLHPRVDGTLDSVAFTEGDMVKAGDVLARLDPRPYQAALDQAVAKKAADVANLANAKLDLVRYTNLSRNQFAAQQQVDTQVALVNQLDAAIKGDDATIAAAQLNLDFTRITAPFNGRVGLRLTDVGNFIRSQDPTNPGIVTLSQIQPVSVTFSLPQDQLPQIAAAMARGKPKVLAATADDRNSLGEGALITIDNTIDPTTGTIKVKASFPNHDLKLWPGQFVNARLETDVLPHALTLPTSAVQHGPNGLYVYRMKPDHTVEMAAVELGVDNGTVAVIAKGVADDDTVVLTGQSRLHPGAKVAPAAATGS